jgi:hypothetical protein
MLREPTATTIQWLRCNYTLLWMPDPKLPQFCVLATSPELGGCSAYDVEVVASGLAIQDGQDADG